MGHKKTRDPCHLDPVSCLGEHITWRLEDATRKGLAQWQARCPVRPHDGPKLAIKPADYRGRRLVWFCHAGCTEAEIRTALIRLDVEYGCLDELRTQRTEDELIAALLPIIKEGAGTLTHLRIAAVVRGLDALPRGGSELGDLAAEAGVPRSTAYRAVERAVWEWCPTHNQSCTSSVTQRPNPDENPQVDGMCNGTPGVPKRDAVSQSETRSVTFRRADDDNPVTERPNLGLSVTPPQRCKACERPLPFTATSRRDYCSTTCRQKAARARKKRGTTMTSNQKIRDDGARS